MASLACASSSLRSSRKSGLFAAPSSLAKEDSVACAELRDSFVWFIGFPREMVALVGTEFASGLSARNTLLYAAASSSSCKDRPAVVHPAGCASSPQMFAGPSSSTAI